MGRSGEQKAYDKGSDDSHTTLKSFFKIVGLFFDSVFFLTIGVIIGGLMFYIYMEYSHSVLKSVRVPDVRGMSISEAKKVLEKLNLVPELKKKICGKVIGTYPNAGMEVRTGRKVEIYCLEATMRELSNMLIGIPYKYVADTIMSLGIDYEISKLPYPGGDGKVLGAVYAYGKMFLLVGEKYSRKFFVVGDYRGERLKNAELRLKKNGISFKVEGNGEKVIDQFPQPGTVWNSVVLITE